MATKKRNRERLEYKVQLLFYNFSVKRKKKKQKWGFKNWGIIFSKKADHLKLVRFNLWLLMGWWNEKLIEEVLKSKKLKLRKDCKNIQKLIICSISIALILLIVWSRYKIAVLKWSWLYHVLTRELNKLKATFDINSFAKICVFLFIEIFFFFKLQKKKVLLDNPSNRQKSFLFFVS
jgi:hypothetical protein